MPSVAPSSSTRLSIGSSQAPLPPPDDAIASPLSAVPVDCSVSPPPAPARETAPDSWPLVPRAPGGSSSLSGACGPLTVVGVGHGGTNACGTDAGASVLRRSSTPTSLFSAADQQSRYAGCYGRARSGSQSPVAQRPARFSLLSSVAAADALAAAAAPTSETASPQSNDARPGEHGATGLASSCDGYDGNTTLPRRSDAHPPWTSAEPTHTGGKSSARALAVNLTQASVCNLNGYCFVAAQPSPHPSSSAIHDMPGSMSVTALDRTYTACSSTQLKLAAAPISTATATSSALPYTSATRCACTSPPSRPSPRACSDVGDSADRIGTSGGSGDQLLLPLTNLAAVGIAAASGAAEGAGLRLRVPAVLSSSSSSPSPLPVYSLCCAGTSAAVPTALSPSVTSGAAVTARTATIGVGDTSSGCLLFPREASLPTPPISDSEAAAASVECSDGQRQQLRQCHLHVGSGAPAEGPVAADCCEENSGTANDCSRRESGPFGSTSPFSHGSRARPQRPRPPPAETSHCLPRDHRDRSARQNARLSYSVSIVPLSGAESSAPGIFLTRCEDEGSVAPEAMRARSDADRTACAVTGDYAKAQRDDTANHSRMVDFVDFDTLNEVVAAKASVAVGMDATAQLEGDGTAAHSNSSSLPTFSQELQRTLPPSAVITAGGHYQGSGQQTRMHMPSSQPFEALYTEMFNTAQQCGPSPADLRTHGHLSDRCSGTLYEADDLAERPASGTPLRQHGVIPSFGLPPRSASGATQRPSTPLPAGSCEHDESGEEELADAAMVCARGSEALPFVAADSLASLSPPLAESSSRLPLTASLMQHIHGRHMVSMATTSSSRTHPLSPAPVTAPSSATPTALRTPATLPAWKRGTLRRLDTRPVESVDFFRLRLPTTAPAETSAVQGRSPCTPRSQRESHLLSQVRVALTDARSVRSHLQELRALLPKHRTHSAAATSAQDIKGATASAEGARCMGKRGVAGARTCNGEAGKMEEVLGGSDDPAGLVGCTTAMSPLSFFLLQRALRESKADDLGGEGGRSRASGEGCSGDSSTLQTRASSGGASSQLQPSQGLHRSSGDIDGDGHDDSDGSLEATFNVRGLYTSSLNGYRHQRLTRLTEQHLRSLWFGISAVAKSVCGAAVGECVQMHRIQGPTRVGGQTQRFPCEMTAATDAAAPAAPLLANPRFGAALQQLRRAMPLLLGLTPSTSSPTPGDSPAPSGAAVSAQDAKTTAPTKASPCALRQPPPRGPPDPEPSSDSSRDPRTAALAEGETIMGGERALVTTSTVEVAVQRVANTKRGGPPSGRHPDFQCQPVDEVALLDSVSAGVSVSAAAPPSARTAVLATAANSSAFTRARSEECASVNSHSSAAASTALKEGTKVPTNTSTVVPRCTNSGRYRCSDSHSSSRHDSTASPTTSSKWSNVPTPGNAYIHNTRRSPISATAVPSGLNDAGSSNGRCVHTSSCSGSDAREGGGGFMVAAAGSPLSGLSRPETPPAATTEPAGSEGPPLYTLPSTLLLHLQQQQSLDSSSPWAPSASVGDATPSSWNEPRPIATITALPQHNSSSSWNWEGGGTPIAPANGITSCPLTGGTPRLMWMPPSPSPVPPPPPTADHRGAAEVTESGASVLPVASPTVPSVLPVSYGAAGIGVDAGAFALQGLYTRSSGVGSATPLASPSRWAWMSLLLAAMPTPPVKASFSKVVREEVAADTMPHWDANARASGVRLAAAGAVAPAASAGSPVGHARGERHEQSPNSSTRSPTSHGRPGGGGAAVRSGVATGCGTVAAATIPMEAREEANSVLHSVNAAATSLPASVCSCSMLAEGELSVVPVLHESMGSIAREIDGSSETSASSVSTPAMIPDSLLSRPGGSQAFSSPPALQSPSSDTAVPAAGLAPFAANSSSEGVEGVCSSFLLLYPTATAWTQEHMRMLPPAKTAAAASTTIPSYITGNHPLDGGSASGTSHSGSGAMGCRLPSSSASRRQPQTEHALGPFSTADAALSDARLHNDQPLAHAATEAESAALPSATEQALLESQPHHTRGEDESTSRWAAQALPLLRSSLLLLETTRAPSTPSSPAPSALSAEGAQEAEVNGASGDGAAAVKASDRPFTRAVAEGLSTDRKPYADVTGGAGAAGRKDETYLGLGFSTVRELISSLPSPRPQGQNDHAVTSADAPPRAASSTSSSLPCTTVSASTAEATSAAVAAIAVAGARVPLGAPSAARIALLQAEQQPWHRGDDRCFTHSVPTPDWRLHNMCDEGANAMAKRSRSGSSDSSGNAAADRDSRTPPRGAMRGDKGQRRSLHAVPSPAKPHLSRTPASATTPLAMNSTDRTDALTAHLEGGEEEFGAISAPICAASLPAHLRSREMGTDGSRPHSPPPTMAVSAQAEAAHSIPMTEAEVCEADASVPQVTPEVSAADTCSSLAPSFVDSVIGVAAALDKEQTGALNTIVQSPDMPHTVAHAHRHTSEDRGEASETKEERADVAVGEAAARESEDGRGLLSLDTSSDLRDLMGSFRRVPMHHQAQQRQQYRQHPLMHTWSSFLTISSSGHSAATTSSLRTTVTSMTLSTSMVALGSRLSGSSTMTSGTSTALASVAEAILGIDAAGSAGGGGSSGGGPSAHTGAIRSIGTTATTPAAAEPAGAAASFTVTMIASATAAAGNSSWTPNSTVTLSSASASVAGSTSLSTALGTTVSSSASNSLSPERYSSISSSGAGGGVAAEVPSVSSAGQGEGTLSLMWFGAKAPWQAENTAPVAISAAGAAAVAVGGGGAACDTDADAFGLDTTCSSALDFVAGRPLLLSRLKPLPPLPPPQSYPFLLPEVSSPHLCYGDGGFEDEEDDVVTDGYAQNTDPSALLDTDLDPEREERRCAAAPVRGGSYGSPRVETPRCGETDGAGSAYSNRSAEDRGGVAKSADSPHQHNRGGKVNAEASPTQSPLRSRTHEVPSVTEAAAFTAVAAGSVPDQHVAASACDSDHSSGSGGDRDSVSSHAAGEAASGWQAPPAMPFLAGASTRTATTDDSAVDDASPYAAVMSRATLKQASRAGTHKDEDDSRTECRTSPAHLSARALSPFTIRLPTSIGSYPAATTATATSGSAVSTMEGGEAVRAISCPRSADSVPRTPSSPLICATNASAASRSPNIASDSPLRQRGATAITESGDVFTTSMTTTVPHQTAGVAIAVTAATAAVMESVSMQTCRGASRLYHVSVDASALSQGRMTASSSNSSHSDVGCRLSERKATPLAAMLEVGALMPLSREAALDRSSWREDVEVESHDVGIVRGPAPLSPSKVPQERRSPIHGNDDHEDMVAGTPASQLDLPSQWLPGSTDYPSDGGGPTRACEWRARRVFMDLKGGGGDASGDGVAAVSVHGSDAIDQAAAKEDDGRGSMVKAATSEDAAAVLITPWPPAMWNVPQRQTCWSAPLESSLAPVMARVRGGAETPRDGGGLGADPAVAKAVRTVSAACLFDSGVVDQTNCACADDIGNRVVEEGETSAALESRSCGSGTGKGIRVVAATTPPARASHDVESCGAEDGAVTVMVPVTRGSAEERPTAEVTAARTAAAAAAVPTASLHPSPSSSSTLCLSDAPPGLLLCSHEGPLRRLPPKSLSSAPIGCVDGDSIAVPRAAEKGQKRHDDSHAVDVTAMTSPAGLEIGGALPIASGPLATTPSLPAADTFRSEFVVSRPSPEAASRIAPEQAHPAKLPASHELPPLPLPQTRLSIPSYYRAQCEDGLADVAGSLHGWHAGTSAFFPEVATAATPGRTHSAWSGLSSGASDMYTPVSVLARRRARQRARYHVARLGGTAAPSYMPTTAADSPLTASAMPVLASQADATVGDSERVATTSTSPSSTAVDFTHNDRLLALMKGALQLAG